MRIAVIGATGRTGRLVVEQGLERGHQVTAVARRPEAVTAPGEHGGHLVAARADVLDGELLARALAGSEAVVSALGVGTSRARTRVYSEGIANVLEAMRSHGIGRLAVISAAPVGPRGEQPFLERRVVMPVLERLFACYEDMRRPLERRDLYRRAAFVAN